MSPLVSPAKDGAIVSVRVTPRADREAISGVVDDVLHVRVTAAPADGQANKAVCKLLARLLDVPPSTVSVRRGETARVKQLSVAGADAAVVERAIHERAQAPGS